MVSYASSQPKHKAPNGIHKRPKLKKQLSHASSVQDSATICLEDDGEEMIGMLTKKERLFRVQRFMEKKRHFNEIKKQQI